MKIKNHSSLLDDSLRESSKTSNLIQANNPNESDVIYNSDPDKSYKYIKTNCKTIENHNQLSIKHESDCILNYDCDISTANSNEILNNNSKKICSENNDTIIRDNKYCDKNFNYSKINDNENSSNNEIKHEFNMNNNVDLNKIYLKKRKYGNMITFWQRGTAPMIAIGPNWGFFLAFTFILFITFFGIFVVFGNRIYLYFRIAGITVYIVQFTSYTLCAILDPGLGDNSILENNDYILDEKIMHVCSECGLIKKLNSKQITFHCLECDVCIEGYDHHCPWTTKCVGKKNLIWFYIFVLSTFIYLIIIFISIGSLG